VPAIVCVVDLECGLLGHDDGKEITRIVELTSFGQGWLALMRTDWDAIKADLDMFPPVGTKWDDN